MDGIKRCKDFLNSLKISLKKGDGIIIQKEIKNYLKKNVQLQRSH